MKPLRLLALLIISLCSNFLYAEKYVEKVTFCGKSQVSMKTGETRKSKTVVYEDGFAKFKTIIRGEVRVLEVDSDTLETTLTVIPTSLKIEKVGALFRMRMVSGYAEGCKMEFRIYNSSGKKIDAIFGTFQGLGAGVAAILNIGAKIMINENNNFVVSMDTLFMGLGVDLSYVSFTLRPFGSKENKILVHDVSSSTVQQVTDKESVLNRVLN